MSICLLFAAKEKKAMPRPKCRRRICGMPDTNYFKPRGIPAMDLEEVLHEAAHRKIADVLIHGKALKIEANETAENSAARNTIHRKRRTS